MSETKLQHVYSTVARRQRSDFWSDISGTVWDASMNFDPYTELRKYIYQLRKVRIIVSNYFVGDERIALMLLFTSVSPMADIAAVNDSCLEEVYRKVYYLRRVLTELVDYFNKKTYKQADQLMRQFLSPISYKVFQLCVRTRDAKLAGFVMGWHHARIRLDIAKTEKLMQKHSAEYPAIKDLYRTWHRVRGIKKMAYGWHKKFLAMDIDKIPQGVSNDS